MEVLDCRDHSCRFAKDKGGVRTNGGCRCLKEIPEALRHRIHATFHALEQEVARLKDQGKTACSLLDDLKATQIQVREQTEKNGVLSGWLKDSVDKEDAANRLNGELKKELLEALECGCLSESACGLHGRKLLHDIEKRLDEIPKTGPCPTCGHEPCHGQHMTCGTCEQIRTPKERCNTCGGRGHNWPVLNAEAVECGVCLGTGKVRV